MTEISNSVRPLKRNGSVIDLTSENSNSAPPLSPPSRPTSPTAPIRTNDLKSSALPPPHENSNRRRRRRRRATAPMQPVGLVVPPNTPAPPAALEAGSAATAPVMSRTRRFALDDYEPCNCGCEYWNDMQNGV